MEKLRLNKGFSIIEMLLILVILALLNLLTLKPLKLNQLNYLTHVYHVEDEYLKSKINSFEYVEKHCLMSHYIEQNHNLCINKRGNVNQAITLRIINSNKTMTVHLGSGVYEIK